MFRQHCTGGIAGGREAARATAPHLIARSPPAMSPKVTRVEPQPQGFSDRHLTACPVSIFWTERQKGLLKVFTPGADFADSSLPLAFFETINRLHFSEREISSLPPRQGFGDARRERGVLAVPTPPGPQISSQDSCSRWSSPPWGPGRWRCRGSVTVTGLDTASTADHVVFQPLARKRAAAHHP